MTRRTACLRDRSGSAALEFCFILWPFFALIFAMFDLGHYMVAQHSLTTLSSEISRAIIVNCGGANYGKLSSACANPLTLTQEQTIAPILYLNGAAPTIAVNTATANVISVTVSLGSFPTVLPWWGNLVGSLTSTTRLNY